MTTLPAIRSDQWKQRNYIDAAIDARVNLTDSTKDQYRNEVKKAVSPICTCGHKEYQHGDDSECNSCDCIGFVFDHDGVALTDATSVAAYAVTLAPSSRAFLRAAIRTWTKQLQRDVKAQATPETMDQVGATLHRLDALSDSIELERSNGRKAHIWLTDREVTSIMRVPRGRTANRDEVVLGLLMGAGLRRNELVKLCWKDIKRQGDRTVLQVHGKGRKNRIVPISNRLVSILDKWREYSDWGPEGFIVRGLAGGGILTANLTSAQVFNIVRRCGRDIGKPGLAPHDLRRTYAEIGHKAGIPITQLSLLLGHSSVAVTERYLNIRLDLEVTASDFIPL